MKKILLIGVAAMLIAVAAISCSGISQEEYTAVLTERDNARAEREGLQKELNTARNEAGLLESQLVDAGNEKSELELKIASLEVEISRARSKYSSLKEKISRAKMYADILDMVYFVPSYEMSTAELLQVSGMIEDTQNDEFMAKFTAYVDSGSVDDYLAWLFTGWEGAYAAFK